MPPPLLRKSNPPLPLTLPASYVTEVLPRSQASRNGRVLPGDRLLSVCSVSVKTFAQACDVITGSPASVLGMTFERGGGAASPRAVDWDRGEEDP